MFKYYMMAGQIISIFMAKENVGRSLFQEEINKWFDRSKQPRCNICGRFAYWNNDLKQWKLKCVFESDEGWTEHE